MASGYVQVPADSVGKKVDCVSLSAGGSSVVRQTIVVADPTSSSGFATVTGGKLNVNASVGAMPNVNISSMPAVAISGTVTVAGNLGVISGTLDKISATVLASITNKLTIDTISAAVATVGQTAQGGLGNSNWPLLIGGLDGSNLVRTLRTNANGELVANISSMPAISIGPISTIDKISATVLAAITSSINLNISAMPSVTIGTMPNVNVSSLPAVSLAAGATLDGISKTVNVVVTNAINISSMPAISIGPISKIDVISATVTVAGTVNISSMPAITVSVGPITTIDKISATVTVAGTVAINGQVNIGSISAVVLIAGPQATGTSGTGNFPVLMGGLASGNSGNVNMAKVDISGSQYVNVVSTVTVVGAVTITSGAIDISSMPKVSISGSVLCAVTGTVNISGSVLAAVTGTVNISGTPSVVLGAGTANFGTLNNISATVNVAITANTSRPMAVPSASHGPKTVSLSASASVALIAAPGAATSIYVTEILATNGSPTLTQLQIYEASATATPNPCQYLAANGGGFSVKFDPPWKVSANTALNGRLKPSVSAGLVLLTINFYTGA
jgi:hypothetical protein